MKKKQIIEVEPVAKVGDSVRTRPFLNKCVYGTISKVEPLDDGVSFRYEINAVDGLVYVCFAPEIITKKMAKELIGDSRKVIEFLQKI